MDDYNIFLKWGIEENASDRDIVHAYRRRAQSMHPDKNQNSAKSQTDFCQLQDEYLILKNFSKRHALLDRIQKDRDIAAKSADFVRYDTRKGALYKHKSPKNKTNQQHTNIPPGDINVSLSLTLKEVLSGGYGRLCVQTASPCGCDRYHRCPRCRGTGQVFSFKMVDISWPSGVKDGENITIKNAGHQGSHLSGDLNILIRWVRKNGWIYDGENLRYKITLPHSIWMRGGEVWFVSPKGDYGFLLLNSQKSNSHLVVLKVPNMGFSNGSYNGIVYLDLSISRSSLSFYYLYSQKLMKFKAYLNMYKNRLFKQK